MSRSTPTSPAGPAAKVTLLLGLLAPLATACDTPARPSAEACARLEEGWSLESIPAGACQGTSGPRDLSDRSKLAVAVYHFNLQYVAGGIRGFPDGELTPANNFSEAETEDRIIRQGIEPVLDLFMAHPSFAADLEMQAYTLEVMAERHPDVLTKLRALVAAGQVDVDSFHYSDQLYVAYPRRDLEASLDLTQQVFDRLCLPRGGSIFTQEGQFAVGQLPIAAARGYRVSVLPKNLYAFQFGEGEPVLFRDPAVPGHAVILGGRGYSATNSTGPFELVWTFMDDGEIAFSKGRLNPYFGLDYVLDPQAIAEHAARLTEMEAQGYTHATIQEAVRAMERRGFVATELPPVLDGTWQPKDTGNVLRWMGGGGLFKTQEQDSEVLAAVWRARTAVERVERRLPRATSVIRRGLDAAWREVSLAAVSDSTGWNPFVNEVNYAFTHAAAAETLAQDVEACAGLPPSPPPQPSCTPSTVSAESLGVTVQAPARPVTVRVSSCAPTTPGSSLWAIDVAVEATATTEEIVDPSEQAANERLLDVAFGGLAEPFWLLQALEEAPRPRRLADYTFEQITVPLPLGLIGLSEDRWVIQDQATGRLGATLDRREARRGQVIFVDQTVTRVRASTRRYYLAEGLTPGAAAGLAERINRPHP